jgi:hypothetical protein
MHVLPKGYTGQVTIIFDDKEGEEPTKANGMRVYKIPPSGTLKTQFHFESGYFPCTLLHYYYVSGNDTTSIEELALTNKDSINKRKVFMYNRSVSEDTMRYWVGPAPIR